MSEKYTNKGSTVYENDEELSTIDIVDLLNELSDENGQLRKDKAQLKERLRECVIRLDKFNCR